MSNHIELHALPHPDPRIRRLGFELNDPYVEQCWGAVVGPSAVSILRRLPVLWTEREPAHVASDDFARSLGLGGGTGQNGRLHRTLDRLTRFGLAEWLDAEGTLGIYTDVAPLSARQVAQLPDWTRTSHERLLDSHLDSLASANNLSAKAAEVTARLDRLQQPATYLPTPAALLGR